MAITEQTKVPTLGIANCIGIFLVRMDVKKVETTGRWLWRRYDPLVKLLNPVEK